MDILRDLADAARTLDRAAFEQKEPWSVLLVAAYLPLDDTGFKTEAAGLGRQGGALALERIKKREGGNVFLTMVTLGRSRNNDIVLRQETVSKFHAFFTLSPDPARTITITDAGSANGTFVKGRRLTPQVERVALASGDGLRLGELDVTYYTSGGFWERVRSGGFGEQR